MVSGKQEEELNDEDFQGTILLFVVVLGGIYEQLDRYLLPTPSSLQR